MVTTIKKLLKNGVLTPYIKYVRFPCFRNLEKGTKITFDFPLTVLVGQNGTNKSSVLRALYGCPGNNSIGKFWFATKVDPINDNQERPKIIYGYYQPDAKREVEVIKTRIKKKFKVKRDGKTRERVDPDYWEPSRPILRHGMEKMPDDDGRLLGRSKTRWNNIEKNVVFIDFRSEISAFDKYFYHGVLKQTITQHNKQDVIRRNSSNLKKIIENDLSRLVLRNKNVLKKNIKLKNKMVEEVSKILGREYSCIRLVQHELFKNNGYSAVLQFGNVDYSEAWAGSGEFAVIKLVYNVMSANEHSLIILDEPEVSLHPGAQTRLQEFLLEQIKRGKHQVVIGTHSPYIIKGLPPEAIINLSLNPSSGKVIVQQPTLPEQAFFHLGVPVDNKVQIITEDRLASAIVKKCLRIMGQAIDEKFDVISPSGGASSILHGFMPAFAATGRKDVLILLDGDQKTDLSIPSKEVLNSMSSVDLLSKVTKFAGGTTPKFAVDGGQTGGNEEQMKLAYVDYLDFGKEYVRYLPNSTPEDFIWEHANLAGKYPELVCIEGTKERFVKITELDLGKANYENIKSSEILATQERFLATISNDNRLLTEIIDFLHDYCKAPESK